MGDTLPEDAWPPLVSINRIVGPVGMWESLSDFQGRWEEWESVFWISTLSTARHFLRPFSPAEPAAAGDETGGGTYPASRSPTVRIKLRSSDRRSLGGRDIRVRRSR